MRYLIIFLLLASSAYAEDCVCGSANGKSFTSAESIPIENLCKTGTVSSITGNGPWTWSCGESCKSVLCSAKKIEKGCCCENEAAKKCNNIACGDPCDDFTKHATPCEQIPDYAERCGGIEYPKEGKKK